MTVWILWEAVSEARYYNLYRAADGAPAVLLATVQDTRYADRQADPGTRYEYFVRSVNASGEGENSAPSVAPPAKAADDPKAVPGAGKVVELRRVIKSGVAYALKEPVDLQRAGGLLFVSDPAARSVFVLDDQGTLVRRLGPDTAGVNGRWGTPWGLCATASGNRVAVAFPDVGRVRVFSDGGEVLLDVGVPPPSAGDKVNARKPAPFDVVLLPDGGLWVTDSANAHVVRLDAQGNEKARLGAVRSEKNASGAHEPTYLAFDPQSETLYVVDSLAATILAVDGSGVVVRKWRRFSAPVGPLCLPKGISVTSAGDLLIVDGILSTVQRFTAEGELIAVYAKKDSKTVGVRGIVAAVEGNVPGQVFVASNLLGRVFELGVVSSP
jgi:DNA-binding beta-propeller fold protein YncE